MKVCICVCVWPCLCVCWGTSVCERMTVFTQCVSVCAVSFCFHWGLFGGHRDTLWSESFGNWRDLHVNAHSTLTLRSRGCSGIHPLGGLFCFMQVTHRSQEGPPVPSSLVTTSPLLLILQSSTLSLLCLPQTPSDSDSHCVPGLEASLRASICVDTAGLSWIGARLCSDPHFPHWAGSSLGRGGEIGSCLSPRAQHCRHLNPQEWKRQKNEQTLLMFSSVNFR